MRPASAVETERRAQRALQIEVVVHVRDRPVDDPVGHRREQPVAGEPEAGRQERGRGAKIDVSVDVVEEDSPRPVYEESAGSVNATGWTHFSRFVVAEVLVWFPSVSMIGV